MPNRAGKLNHTAAKLPSIPTELVARFQADPMTGEAIDVAEIAFRQALIGVSLNSEPTRHLTYGPEQPEAAATQRNGFTSKTVLTGEGKVRIATTRGYRRD